MITNHTYESYYYSGNYYHFLTTDASNIKLANLRAEYGANKTIAETVYLGINASFFNMVAGTTSGIQSDLGAILNIAVFNGVRMSTLIADNYNAGTINRIGRGAIGWDGAELQYHSNITYASEASYSGNYGTWIQGGIALWLGYSDWETKFREQGGASMYLTGTAYRSAMIADVTTNRVILAVSPNATTTEVFRSAIEDYLGIFDTSVENSVYKAIMLDGSYSSQMVAKRATGADVRVPDPAERAIPQIIALRSNN